MAIQIVTWKKGHNCHDDNGNNDNTKMETAMKTTAMIDNETRGHLSLQHVLLLEIGLHVCRHPKMPIFYSGQVCDEKEQSKLDHHQRSNGGVVIFLAAEN